MNTGSVEVGVIRAHPIKVMFLYARTVFRTWRAARKLGIPANNWYGVYERGTEITIALMGCTLDAKSYAQLLSNAENKRRA